MALHHLNEGNIVDDAGNVISVWYIDMRDPDSRVPITTLIKGGRSQHAIGTLGTIRVSKPAHFRHLGEGLIKDPADTLVSRSVTKSTQIDPSALEAERAEAREFEDEINKCAGAIEATAWGTRRHTHPQERSRSRTIHLTLGKNGWIYSTSIEPGDDEDSRRWRASMPEEYDHFQRIHQRRAFARALGLMAVEQLGPRGEEVTVNSKFEEQGFVSTHPNQIIVHGPVVYTENAFDLAARASSKAEREFLPVFAKDIRYADQREYRFAIWTDAEPEEEYVDLRVSQAMLGSLDERRDATAEPKGTSPKRPQARVPKTSEQIRESPPETGMPSSLFRDGSIYFPHRRNPTTTPVVPRAHTDGELDEAVLGVAAAEAALEAFRYKVEQVSGQRRRIIAAAAWHAEPWIRSLCWHFEDPVDAVWISDDDILVVELKFPAEIEANAKIGFGPSGARVYGVKGGASYRTSSSSWRETDRFGADTLIRTLDELGLRRRSATP